MEEVTERVESTSLVKTKNSSDSTEHDEKYNECCQQLDVLSVEALAILDTILEYREQHSELLKDGFFLMSKSRYSMGTNAVSQLQYPEHMSATIDVDTVEKSESSNQLSSALSHEQKIKLLEKYSPGIGELIGDCAEFGAKKDVIVEVKYLGFEVLSPAKPDSTVTNRVRKRLLPTDGKGVTDDIPLHDISPQSTSDGAEKYTPTSSDPIQWFGVLVPQSLRQCRDKFKHALAITCQIASLQNQLCEIRNQFLQLKARKEILSQVPRAVEQ